MRQFIVLAAICGLCVCGRLESKYLPANQGGFNQGSSNQGGFNQGSSNQGSSNQGGFNHGSANGNSGYNQDTSSQGTYNQGSYTQGSYNQGGYDNSQSQGGPINKAANDVPILKLDNNNDGETYNYAVETGDGVSVQEHGDARGDGTNAEGGFSYTAPDGQQIQIQYTANQEGFIPQGSHLPTAPPIPADILKAVEQNLADEAKGIYDDGQYKEDQQSGYNNYKAQQSGGFGGHKEQTSQNVNHNFPSQQKQYNAPAASNQGQNGYTY